MDNWDDIKLHIMFNLLLYKFSFKKNKQKLLATGDEELCEGNIWHDNFWGDCHCEHCIKKPGINHLGRLLMKVRELKRLELTLVNETYFEDIYLVDLCGGFNKYCRASEFRNYRPEINIINH